MMVSAMAKAAVLAGVAGFMAGAVLTGGMTYSLHHQRMQAAQAKAAATVADLQREYEARARASVEEAMAVSAARIMELEDEIKAANNRAAQASRAADASRRAAGRLRDEVATTRLLLPVAAADAVREYADTAAGLLAESAERYSDMAAKAQGHYLDDQLCRNAYDRVKNARPAAQ